MSINRGQRMRDSELQVVRGLPLFSGMQESHFATLVTAAFLQSFPPGVQLISEGQLPDFLHVNVEGAVELFSAHAGRETTIDIVVPTTTFILAAAVLDEVYLTSARTLTHSRVLMIPADRLRDVFGRDSAFARAVVGELALRYRGVLRALKSQKLRPGTERLANWILEMDARGGFNGHFLLPFEKRTVAALIGTTPEHLSRSFATLEAHGVTRDGRMIVIADRGKLERLAQPNPLIEDAMAPRPSGPRALGVSLARV
jgi:CRP/FNR family transcriptional regulator, transcriptional activator FtrB